MPDGAFSNKPFDQHLRDILRQQPLCRGSLALALKLFPYPHWRLGAYVQIGLGCVFDCRLCHYLEFGAGKLRGRPMFLRGSVVRSLLAVCGRFSAPSGTIGVFAVCSTICIEAGCLSGISEFSECPSDQILLLLQGISTDASAA